MLYFAQTVIVIISEKRKTVTVIDGQPKELTKKFCIKFNKKYSPVNPALHRNYYSKYKKILINFNINDTLIVAFFKVFELRV